MMNDIFDRIVVLATDLLDAGLTRSEAKDHLSDEYGDFPELDAALEAVFVDEEE